jgi:hypothetical protein
MAVDSCECRIAGLEVDQIGGFGWKLSIDVGWKGLGLVARCGVEVGLRLWCLAVEKEKRILETRRRRGRKSVTVWDVAGCAATTLFKRSF